MVIMAEHKAPTVAVVGLGQLLVRFYLDDAYSL